MFFYLLTIPETPGDKWTFAKAYFKYRKLIKHEALQVLQNEELAEDATQEALIHIARSVQQFRGKSEESERAYVCVIAHNAAVDLYRKEKRHLEHKTDPRYFEMPMQEDFLGNIAQGDIINKIKELPPQKRRILELWAFHGESRKAIAKTLGISYNVVQKELRSAQELLYKKLKEADLI